MNRRISPHSLKVSKVNVFGGHAALMSDKREIALSKVIQCQGLDRRRGSYPFHRFLSAINKALLGLFLVGGLAGLKPLSPDRISVGHPPDVASLVESLR